MRSDSEIKRDVEDELQWDADIDPTDIAVAVRDGIVTLTGFVKSYNDKWEAERAAKRVHGVLGVSTTSRCACPASTSGRIRTSRARRWRQLRASCRSPTSKSRSWSGIEGEVEWNYQRETAERAVRRLIGIKGVTNLIQVKRAAPPPTEIKRKIEEAFRRSAEIDANRITVETEGSTVILKGTVRSWAEREEAERAAWAAPGVTKVDNRIRIGP
jgi:osmotically-inducible protein OsmY